MAIRKDDMMQVPVMAREIAALTEHGANGSLWIPLNRLKDSPKNVRLVPHTQEHIKTLAALIQADRQLYPLIVEPERDGSGAATGDYEVLAGKGRRLAQLERAKQGLIPADHPIWCQLGDTAHARETSLADNVQAPMHPADQFVAFKALLDEGKTLEDVAARFCVSPAVIHQRLKLANVAPEFLDLFRRGRLQLDHMQAFALTDDHEAQRAAWASLPQGNRPATWIRQALVKDELPLSSPLAKFVGAAYQKAGGAVRRDLFQTDDAYIVDTALLTQLATAKLERAAARLKKEGCAWVEPRLHADYADLRAFGRVETVVRDATEAEATRLQAIAQEREQLEAQASCFGDEDEQLSALLERIDALQAEGEAITEARCEPNPEQQRVAGAIVNVDELGKLRIERGLLRPEDQRRFAKESRAAATGANGKRSSRPRQDSAQLVRELTAHKTLALQAVLASRPDVAVIALTHRLAMATFQHAASALSAVRISARQTDLRCCAQDIKEAKAFKALQECERTLRAALPRKPQAWLDWLLKQPQEQVLALLAYCVAVTIDGVQAHEDAGPADALARATGLDMRAWWNVTAGNYLSRVPKERVIEVVREAVSPEATAGMRDMKKAALAAVAEKRIAGKGWLPPVLRTASA